MAITLYGFWRSIAAFRVRAALHLKGLAFEEISVDILTGHQFDADYDALNAAHAVPTLLHEGRSSTQSLAIMEYLDEVFPAIPLLPSDPQERAYARSFALVTVADAHPLIVPRLRNYLAKTYHQDAAGIDAWGHHWTAEGLATFEKLLTRRPADPFVLGPQPTLADICLGGHTVSALYFKVDLTPYPQVAALAERLFALPAMAAAHPLRQPGAPVTP
jgi:maleylacetoacetate isomerase